MPHFKRFRALALFTRRPHERVEGSSLPASENLHITGIHGQLAENYPTIHAVGRAGARTPRAQRGGGALRDKPGFLAKS